MKSYKYSCLIVPFGFMLFFVLAKCSTKENKVNFYISPDGNDSWSGRSDAPNKEGTDGPFRTLAKARDAVRSEIPGSKEDVTVMIRGGKYVLDETVVFGPEDSGNEKCRIIYRNYPGERPVFTSGRTISGWEKLEEAVNDVQEHAKDKIFVAELPADFKHFYSLFEDTIPLPRARSKGAVLPYRPDVWQYEDKSSFVFEKGTLRNRGNIEDIDIVIRPYYAWVMNILPLKSIDEKNNIAHTSVKGTYPLRKFRWGRGTVNMWIENALNELDKPGEWVYHSSTRKLYLWPKDGKPGDKIVAPQLIEFFRIEGETDYEGKTDKATRHIVFEGLNFTCADYFRRTNDWIGKGIQHDWEYFDAPTAMVRMRGAENCEFRNCSFLQSSSSAIRLDLHCQNNNISGNVIKNIGGTGILLAGYGPGTKDVNKDNRITNNHISDVGQVYWHSPAIFLWQSGGNLVANNLIYNTPYTGIVVSGRIVWDKAGIKECSKTVRWHEVGTTTGDSTWKERERFLHGRNNIIEKNELHHVMEVLGDGNGIYISGAGRGNIVRQNYIHDCPSNHFAEGIRCDDDQHETTIESNIIVRLGGMATGICSKGRNDIINNIVAMPLTTPARGLFALEGTPVDGSLIKHNIVFVDNSGSPLYYLRRTSGTGGDPELIDCKVDKNIYYCTTDENWGMAHLKEQQQYGIELKSKVADPLFVDPWNDDFRLNEDSPGLKLGFQQINRKAIGLNRSNKN
ncbi:MAG: right-handed parallel beta-helix repeat-containing protein [Cytophagales bacterium]|nr:right-handed parallel beta-helix repeat-containing protein [Cytophagales bacterium]